MKEGGGGGGEDGEQRRDKEAGRWSRRGR